jgi:hypothetical protein
MASERLSGLQKWIIVNCYQMTVLLDNTKLLPLSGRNSPYDRYVFFRDDILLTYFNLKASKKYTFLKVHHFKENKEYYNAQTSVSRTLKNLHDKKYIYNCQSVNCIELTTKGKEKAKELLNVKGYDTAAQPLTLKKNKNTVPFY